MGLVMEEVDSEVILNVMKISSHGIIDVSLSRWENKEMTALKKESCPLETRTTVFVKQYTALRTCHTRKHFRVWLMRSSRFAVCIFVSFLKIVILIGTFNVAHATFMA